MVELAEMNKWLFAERASRLVCRLVSLHQFCYYLIFSVIATPGRLADLAAEGVIQLSSVSYVVR